MNDFEKQFEQIVAGLNIDDRPNAEHKHTLRQQMLATCKDAASDTTASRFQSIYSKIMKSKTTRGAIAAAVIISVLVGIYQLTGSIDGASVVWAGVVEKCQNFQTLTFSVKISDCISIHQGKNYDYIQTDYVITPDIHKTTQMAGSLRRRDYLILNETLIDNQNQVLFIDHTAKHYYRYTLPARQKNFEKDLIHLFKTLPEKADKSLGNKTIDRQKAAGFFLKGQGIDIQIWVNKETYNPVFVEFFDDDSSHPTSVYSDFRFDADIDSINTNIQIPDGYSEINAPEIPFMEPQLSTVNDFIYFLKLYAKYSKDECFPDTVSIKRDKEGLAMSVGLSAIEADKITEAERQELQTKGPQTYDFLSRMKPENDWHYAGKGVSPGSTDVPICWWKEDGVDDYTVIFADLSIGTLQRQDLPNDNTTP